jgi:hypothetical protein
MLNVEKVTQFFTTETTPRWYLMAGGAIVMLFAWGQNWYFFEQSKELAEFTADQERIEDRIAQIQQHSIDFQTFANAYVTAVLEGASDQDERQNVLIDNILAQDAAIDVSSALLGKQLGTELAAYRALLRNMKHATEGVKDIQSMGAFWKAASDLLVARNALLAALEEIEMSDA